MPSPFLQSRRIDLGHVDGRRSRLPRRDHGDAFHRRLQPVRAWRVGGGIALDAAGGPQSSSAWMAAFSALAADPAWAAGALLVEKRGAAVNRSQFSIIVALGTTQTLAWASSYYLPAILADPIARDLGVSSNWIFAAFSASLVISAISGRGSAGRSIWSAAGPCCRFQCPTGGRARPARLHHLDPCSGRRWLLLGIGMGAGLYDAAFGALGRIYGDKARRSSPASP